MIEIGSMSARITQVGITYDTEDSNEITEGVRDVEYVRGGLAEDVKRIPSWTKQITFRGIIASIMIGIIYSVIVMKLNLTTGLVPNLNVSAALLAFVFIQTWTKLLQKANFASAPFSRQENTIIQTCAVACYSIAVGGSKIHSLLQSALLA